MRRVAFAGVVCALWMSCYGPCGCTLNPVVCSDFPPLDGGSEFDAGVQPTGQASLEGPRAFPTPTATFLVLERADGGLDRGRVTVRLTEAALACTGPNGYLPLSPDAGLGRELDLDARVDGAGSVPLGLYLWPAPLDAGYAFSISMPTFDAVGSVLVADTAQLTLTTSNQQVLAGSLSAVFPGDGGALTGTFSAEACGTFVSTGP